MTQTVINIEDLTTVSAFAGADYIAVKQAGSARPKRGSLSTHAAYVLSTNAAVNAVGTLTPAADRLPYFTSASAAALATFTAFGRSLVDDADASAGRTTLGLGSLSTLNTVATAQIDNDAVTYAKMQNVSATDKLLGRSTAGAGDVEEIACTAAGRALLDDADATAQRATLGLVIGTNVQAFDATLLSLAALGTAADKMAFTTGIDTWAEAAITAAGRAIIDDADAAAQRTTLGLGTIATQAANNVAITGGSITGVITSLPSYTVATLPSAATAGQMIYVSNEAGGATPAFSDGTNWRRVADRAIVS